MLFYYVIRRKKLEQKLKELKQNILNELEPLVKNNCSNTKEVYAIQTKYLGKTGSISLLLRELGKVDKEQRPVLGALINSAKEWAQNQIDKTLEIVSKNQLEARYENEKIDISLPANKNNIGHLHPITLIEKEFIDIFEGLGFEMFEGPEIENDYYNFTALNVPKDHPARDMQDTFFINEDLLLRTQTSAGQIRVMENKKPPIKVLIPGKVFRVEDDATHSPVFHQMEGLIVDKNLTVCDLYGILDYLAKKLFSDNVKTRLRPSFFPFTEPSVELDVSCFKCGGKGCSLCKNTGWIEVLGGGMVHPNVLKNVGIDPEEYNGVALGVGMDRIAMLKYGIPNIKLLFENDIRLLKQF